MGSTITPAMSLCLEIVFCKSSILLYSTTKVFFETSSNPPSDTEIPLCAEPEPALTKTESCAP
jgi:hypothetical protein